MTQHTKTRHSQVTKAAVEKLGGIIVIIIFNYNHP